MWKSTGRKMGHKIKDNYQPVAMSTPKFVVV